MNKMAQDALNQKSDLKLIMKGEVIKKNNENFGVTSIIMVSKDKEKIKKLFLELCEQDPNSFYMIYNINLDEKLDEKLHYPFSFLFVHNTLDMQNNCDNTYIDMHKVSLAIRHHSKQLPVCFH